MKYRDPFLGDVDLEKVDELRYHAFGETTIREIYKNKFGDFYIKTWHSGDLFLGGDPSEKMECILADVVKKIYENLKNNPPDNQSVIE